MNPYRGCSISAVVLAWVVMIVCAWKSQFEMQPSMNVSRTTEQAIHTTFPSYQHVPGFVIKSWSMASMAWLGRSDDGHCLQALQEGSSIKVHFSQLFFTVSSCFVLKFPICKVTLFNLPWPMMTNASHLCEVQPGACIGPGSSWLVAGGPNDTQSVSGTAPDLWVAEAFCWRLYSRWGHNWLLTRLGSNIPFFPHLALDFYATSIHSEPMPQIPSSCWGRSARVLPKWHPLQDL